MESTLVILGGRSASCKTPFEPLELNGIWLDSKGDGEMLSCFRLRFGTLIVCLAQTGSCGKEAAVPGTPQNLTADQKIALAHLARASAGHTLTAHERIQEYEKALKYEPANRQARYGLAEALYMTGKEDSALEMWKELSTEQDSYGRLAVKWLANVPASRHSERARKWIEVWRKAFNRQTNQPRQR